jgi:serine/threonine protein kinase
MPLAQAAPLIRGMAAALTYAHQHGVIHSDFKPSNVFIVGDSAKVLDFGIARAARAGDSRQVPGEKPSGVTPLYASCEMLEDGAADTRDDVFCFGIAVHFLLTGKHPFDPFTATQARDLHLPVAPVRTLSRWQNAALARMLRFDRDERSASVEEFLQRLRGGTSGPVRVAMGAAILLAVASLGYLYHAATVGHAAGRQDSDAQFMRGLCNHTGKQAHPSDADAQVLATLLELGNSYLRIGQDPYDPGILSENVSSALGAFQDALTLAPQNCDAAAQGILGVAKAYKSEAKRLYAKGDYRGAAQAATIAQRIWRDSGEMRELLERIERRLPPGPNPQP